MGELGGYARMQVTSIPYMMLLSSTVTGTKGASEGKLSCWDIQQGCCEDYARRGRDYMSRPSAVRWVPDTHVRRLGRAERKQVEEVRLRGGYAGRRILTAHLYSQPPTARVARPWRITA